MTREEKLLEIKRLLFKAHNDLVEVDKIVKEMESVQLKYYIVRSNPEPLENHNLVH